MNYKKYIWVSLLLLAGCAKIPIETVQLSEAIKNEGARMHNINVVLIEKLFQEKTFRINEFVKKEFAPQFLKTFKESLPGDVNFDTEFEDLVSAAYPEIEKYKDSLTNVLVEQKLIILNKLNKDFQVYNNASIELQNFLRSGAKLNQAQSAVLQNLQLLSNNKINIEKIDQAANKFISDAGTIGSKATSFADMINQILN